MILAIVVIVIHLVVGLGVFWPVVALAGYGAGVSCSPQYGESWKNPTS